MVPKERQLSYLLPRASDPPALGLSPGQESELESTLAQATGTVFPAAACVVASRGQVVFQRAYGWLDPEDRQEIAGPDSIFDLASLTKLFVTTAFMTLVEEGRVRLDQPVSTVIPDFTGLRPIQPYDDPLQPGQMVGVVPPTNQPTDAGLVTFWHLLTHSSGLPAWRRLFDLGTREAVVAAVVGTYFSYPVGTRVLYSDLGLILLGLAMEELSGEPLPVFVRKAVLEPLGLSETTYNPPEVLLPRVAPTEFCAWRQRRLRGEVHDENAAAMGGVSGHAGLFSTAQEVAALGQLYLEGGQLGPVRLLRGGTVSEMVREQAASHGERRGLGWMLRSPEGSSCGRYFCPHSYGHTGFTGTSLWVEPQRELVVALLTNRVYYGRDNAQRMLMVRQKVHEAVSR